MSDSGSKKAGSTEDLRKTIGELRDEIAKAKTKERELSSLLDSIEAAPRKADEKAGTMPTLTPVTYRHKE